MNVVRAAYLALFFANTIFAVLFKALGEDALRTFGTFDGCNSGKNVSCAGNQMIFRTSFSISIFFLLQTLFSRFYKTQRRCHAFLILFLIEFPVYIAMLVGSFFIPSSFFDGYAHFSRVVSGFFILFQIVCIVDFSYQLRDMLLDRMEKAIQAQEAEPTRATTCMANIWKTSFLGLCLLALIGAGCGLGYLYHQYGSCGVGIAFPTITVVVAAIILALCVSTWLDVGLLPPCVVAVYLVLMCWQALNSQPSCKKNGAPTTGGESPNAIVYSSLIGAFSMTWTSWRTSTAASNMFAPNSDAAAKESSTKSQPAELGSIVITHVEAPSVQQPSKEESAVPTTATPEPTSMTPEPWQFYLMMFLAGVYMAMVLTDWDSANGASNGVSMWVKIVAQWLTMLLFLWTILAPKLFPDRDFS
ncbi:hypothetical protein Poli38472_005491 [Pythium oligandrum]|uniref:Serine incorporator n=1 Tax=Pythium oligandrum TaxID=41045 RepID=A0A8K1CI29_PYTOL|nr:hypothetical protein Poli38472_005491 [Pythium oligandrum]|eukprot:TMW62873.1 hypothetical protein Poli38472_005491 [Pythium oligandrum]